MRSLRPARALDALNFLLADVRAGLGPYLNVFLVTELHWSQSSVGLVLTTGGLLGLLAQTPVGAWIDATRAKRALLVAALAILSLGAVTVFAAPFFWPVLLATVAMALVGDVFAPLVAALTLGLCARGELSRRFARNAAFDHAGNVATACCAALLGWAFTQRAVFLLVPALAALAAATTLAIAPGAIDHARARGAEATDPDHAPSGFRVLLQCRTLLVFGCAGALFHLANAPLLPLVGQKLAFAAPRYATAMMSACIVGAQLVMLPIALVVGRHVERFGARPFLLAGFAVLPVRSLLYMLSDAPAWLLAVQLLDGVGAGILSALTPLVVADLTRGTGRTNVAQGAVATVHGVGATVSALGAGLLVDRFGYDAAFVTAASVALVAALLLLLGFTESHRSKLALTSASPAAG